MKKTLLVAFVAILAIAGTLLFTNAFSPKNTGSGPYTNDTTQVATASHASDSSNCANKPHNCPKADTCAKSGVKHCCKKKQYH